MSDSSVTRKILVDTDIFVYAADPTAGDKNALAFEIIQDLTNRQQLVVRPRSLTSSTRPRGDTAWSHRIASPPRPCSPDGER